MPIIEQKDTRFYIDGYLQHALDVYKRYVKRKNQDLVGVAVGREGRGKTTALAQILKYLDPTFNVGRVYFDSKSFGKALKEAKEPYKAYLYDEGQEFTSRAALSKLNRRLVNILSRVRKKKLYIGIAIPNFFELDRYPAIHRAEFLIKVFDYKGEWGFFRYWNWKKKKELYLIGKKKYDYDTVKSNFFGRFTKKFVIDEVAYDKKKDESYEEDDEDKTTELYKRLSEHRSIAFRLLKNHLPNEEIARQISIYSSYPIGKKSIDMIGTKISIN